MRYQCLVLDHDDTVVNSTASVNYPAFVQTLRTLRPDVHMTLDDFFSYSFEPGFGALCSDILHFSASEMDFQYRTWLESARTGAARPCAHVQGPARALLCEVRLRE